MASYEDLCCIYWRDRWHSSYTFLSSQWLHNGHDGISNHQPHDCLLNHWFRHRLTKTSKPRVTGGALMWPVNSPHKCPVRRKMFPLDDVIMDTVKLWVIVSYHSPGSWFRLQQLRLYLNVHAWAHKDMCIRRKPYMCGVSQNNNYFRYHMLIPLIAKFLRPTWGPSGADRTQVGPMLGPWTLLSGTIYSCVKRYLLWIMNNQWFTCYLPMVWTCCIII